MSNNRRDYMKVSAGLGEEVIADANKEKMISKLTKRIQEMLEDGDGAERIARVCVNIMKRNNKSE